ncbi:MAG: hypothetical protein ACOYNS_15115 [Bacteroidota bacterium]
MEDKYKIALTNIRPYFLLIWNAKKTIIYLNIVVALVTLGFLIFFVKPVYKSTVTLFPDYGGKSMLGGLGSLASLAGISVGETNPMDIYRNVVFSESVIEPVVYKKYKTKAFSDSVNLIQYFEIEPNVSGEDIDPDRARFVKFFDQFTGSLMKVDFESLTKIISITVKMPERKLSEDVANEVIKSLDEYIRTKRKSYASMQRFYLEKRIRQVSDSLRSAEEALKYFRETNKSLGQSAELMLKQERLTRLTQIQTTIYIELIKQVEFAKLDEIRDAPVLNVKEFAKDPIEKDGPNRRMFFLGIMLFSIVLSTFYFAIFPLMMNKFKNLYREVSAILFQQ